MELSKKFRTLLSRKSSRKRKNTMPNYKMCPKTRISRTNLKISLNRKKSGKMSNKPNQMKVSPVSQAPLSPMPEKTRTKRMKKNKTCMWNPPS